MVDFDLCMPLSDNKSDIMVTSHKWLFGSSYINKKINLSYLVVL